MYVWKHLYKKQIYQIFYLALCYLLLLYPVYPVSCVFSNSVINDLSLLPLLDPMHGPRRVEVVDIKSRQITVRWEPFGYNVTRCHTYNLTVEYRYKVNGKEETREEVCYELQSTSPQHTIRNLPPYTNVSVKLVLRNREGEKESQELNVLTDEDGGVI